jgi:hypothetical protein
MSSSLQGDSTTVYFWISILINAIVLISTGSISFVINSIRREIKSVKSDITTTKEDIEKQGTERYNNQKEFCCTRYKNCDLIRSSVKESVADIYNKIIRIPAIEERLRAGNEKFESLDNRLRTLEGIKR